MIDCTYRELLHVAVVELHACWQRSAVRTNTQASRRTHALAVAAQVNLYTIGRSNVAYLAVTVEHDHSRQQRPDIPAKPHEACVPVK